LNLSIPGWSETNQDLAQPPPRRSLFSRPTQQIEARSARQNRRAPWSSLYSTESRPFDLPASGQIAVKVIHHYGDEVLKLWNVQDVWTRAASPKFAVVAQKCP
jgi:hypothetical protein